MGPFSIAMALAGAAAAPATAPPLPIIAAVSAVELTPGAGIAAAGPISETAPHSEPARAPANSREPMIAFQAPTQFVAVPRRTTFAVAARPAREIVPPAARASSYIPRALLMSSEYIGSRPHERGIAGWGSKVVLRMTSQGASLGVNGGVAGALLRLASLND